jgi:DNA-directed RNA polymerase subunit L
MATIEITKNKPFLFECQLNNFPVSFVNALRRILVGSYLPQVVLDNIQININTTQMPHEMIEHRLKMLPIALYPTDSETIKNSKIELIITPVPDKERLILTDDFKIEKGPSSLFMKDRELNKPLLFIKVRKNEEINLTASLSLTKGSHVCTATYKYHVDADRLKIDRENFLKIEGNDPREFDNFHYQKSYSVDEHGRPNCIDFQLESVGVIKSKELMKMATEHLRKLIDEWITEGMKNISKESEKDVYSISMKKGEHTEGSLIQEMIYHTSKTGFVSYDIPHPLLKDMTLKWISDTNPEEILKEIQTNIHEYINIIEKAL